MKKITLKITVLHVGYRDSTRCVLTQEENAQELSRK